MTNDILGQETLAVKVSLWLEDGYAEKKLCSPCVVDKAIVYCWPIIVLNGMVWQ
jgi:hypothetical protein